MQEVLGTCLCQWVSASCGAQKGGGQLDYIAEEEYRATCTPAL